MARLQKPFESERVTGLSHDTIAQSWHGQQVQGTKGLHPTMMLVPRSLLTIHQIWKRTVPLLAETGRKESILPWKLARTDRYFRLLRTASRRHGCDRCWLCLQRACLVLETRYCRYWVLLSYCLRALRLHVDSLALLNELGRTRLTQGKLSWLASYPGDGTWLQPLACRPAC